MVKKGKKVKALKFTPEQKESLINMLLMDFVEQVEGKDITVIEGLLQNTPIGVVVASLNEEYLHDWIKSGRPSIKFDWDGNYRF